MRTYNHLYENVEILHGFLRDIMSFEDGKLLIRIHSAIHAPEQMDELVKNIREVVPEAHITGCSALEVIKEGKLVEGACLVSVTVLDQAEVVTGHFSCMDEMGQWKSGYEVGTELMSRVDTGRDGFMLVFFPLVYSQIEQFVDTINDSDWNVQMLGGAAYMEDQEGNARPDLSFVIDEDGTAQTDVSYAFISAEELYIFGDYVCGIEPVGRRSVIRSNGCCIEEVDEVPGGKWYSGFLGEEALKKDPSLAHVFPVVKRRNGRGIAYYVDYVREEESSEYVLKSFGELKNGSEISLGYFHPQRIFEIISQTVRDVQEAPAETIFAYDCQSRMSLLHDCASWEIGCFNTTNISGALLSGEISSKNGDNLYANYTFVIAALSEKTDAHFMLDDLDQGSVLNLQEDNVQMLNYLLMNANKSLSEELKEQQSKMQDAVFFNSTMGLDNQLKFQFDKDREALDKTAMLTLNNEKMFRLFSGVTETYGFLKDCYHKMQLRFRRDGLYFYCYNDTSLMLAANGFLSGGEFAEIVEEIHEFLSRFSYEQMQLSYTAAILFSAEDAIQRLETAIHYAKNHKLSIIRFDELGDDLKKEQENIHMLWVVREALLHRRVIPFFQEIHDNTGGTKRMFESLMRLYDAEGNLYFPDRFLPIAKEYDLYDSLSELMVKTVLEMFEKKDIRVTLNLNVQDIYNHNMIQMIFDKLKVMRHPENFVFEIVESEEITDYEYIKKFAGRIHEYGGKVAIDDFGSGFSNLLHVINIEADYIKIDGEIIKTITTDSHCRDFIEFMNGWCEKGGQELICEYIENEQIQNIMEEIGVCFSQGYYFSKPHRWGPEDEAAVS